MIGFLYPWALLGLGAAAIPLLLHLRARRAPPTVPFPAVRYLRDATREHERRLRLGQWLLLLLRTLLVAALVLAAAGPTLSLRRVGPHAPVALVLVVDNSLSSGVRAGGTPRLDLLRREAAAILARAAAGDRLWLLTADGIPRRGDPARLRALAESLEVTGMRMDLGQMVTTAGRILDGQDLPGGIVVLTDLQASAVTPADTRRAIIVGAVTSPVVPNRGVAPLDLGPQPWGPDGGRVVVTIAGNDDSAAVPVSVMLGAGPVYQVLVGRGHPASIAIPGRRAGWYQLSARLDPDELRGDDERIGVVRVAPPARVSWSAADRYVAAGLATLAANRRVVTGPRLRFGSLGDGASIVVPPEDPAEIGVLNRALAARGVTWHYGAPQAGESTTDSSFWLRPVVVTRRYELIPAGSGRTGVLLTAGRAPWLVRSGNVLLLGSRLDPGWTALPLSAGFVPFLDALVNRMAPGDEAIVEDTVGVPVILPDQVTDVRQGPARWPVASGTMFTPPAPGLYWLLAGADTVGALAANPDPRESDLTPATPAAVRGLWPTARMAPLGDVAPEAYGLGVRTDLRSALLWTVLILALAELLVASAGATRERISQ